MGYKMTVPTCYVVAWDADCIVKAGYSAAQRWRKFLLRGARLVQLTPMPRSTEAFDLETELFDYMASIMPHAFNNLADSRPFLGSDGGGWRECFRLPSSGRREVWEACARIATAACDRSAPLDARTYLRTNGLT